MWPRKRLDAPRGQPHFPQCATDADISIKLAAARAAGRLLTSELSATEGAASRSLERLSPALVALLGPEQKSDVQRAAMATLRAVARAGGKALEAQLPELLPSLCSVVGAVQGPLKMTAERTLAAVSTTARPNSPAQTPHDPTAVHPRLVAEISAAQCVASPEATPQSYPFPPITG